MRSLWSVAIFLAVITRGATILSGQDSTVQRTLSSGIVLSIPAGWQLRDSISNARIRSVTDSVLSKVQNKALREDLQVGRPQVLFAAHHPTKTAESVNLNAARSPGTTAGDLTGLSDSAIAKRLEQACPALGEMVQRMNGRLITCHPARALKVKTRTAALMEYVRTGPTGPVHTWLVQFPDNNVVFTLTLSCLESERAQEEPVLRQIWESIEIPVAD
jgi:hypothetical protein